LFFAGGGERAFFFAGGREGLRRSERDRSEGGRASPVAGDLAGVREGELGRESSGGDRESIRF
jgi:hypothetical protein